MCPPTSAGFPAATPASPPPGVPAPATPERGDWRTRWLASGLLGISGGFVVFSSSLPNQLAMATVRGYVDPMPMLLLGCQMVFGIAMVVAAYLLAPGRVGMGLLGAVIFIVGIVAQFLFVVIRLTPGGPVLPPWLGYPAVGITVLAGAIGWLVASGARPVSWLSLISSLLMVGPVGFGLTLAGADGTLATLAVQVGALVAALIVLGASAVGRRPATP